MENKGRKITQEELKDLFDYCDGSLVWKQNRGRQAKVGGIAGTPTAAGYVQINTKQKKYLAHRLIYLWHYGVLPDALDHINGDRVDNRIENLRPCNPFENTQNSLMRKDNTSGVKGVNWKKQENKWVTRIQVEGNRKYLGSFTSLEDAKLAITEARNKLHGEFANHG